MSNYDIHYVLRLSVAKLRVAVIVAMNVGIMIIMMHIFAESYWPSYADIHFSYYSSW